jgi:hypothetical protein
LPEAGATIELTEQSPDWGRLPRHLKQMGERLEALPWTHERKAEMPKVAPPHGGPGAPSDPLADVEALR